MRSASVFAPSRPASRWLAVLAAEQDAVVEVVRPEVAARRAGGHAAVTRSRRIPPRSSLRCLPSLIHAGSHSTRLMVPGIEPRSLNWALTDRPAVCKAT